MLYNQHVSAIADDYRFTRAVSVQLILMNYTLVDIIAVGSGSDWHRPPVSPPSFSCLQGRLMASIPQLMRRAAAVKTLWGLQKKEGQLAEWRHRGVWMGGPWICEAAGRNDGGDPASGRRINELRRRRRLSESCDRVSDLQKAVKEKILLVIHTLTTRLCLSATRCVRLVKAWVPLRPYCEGSLSG